MLVMTVLGIAMDGDTPIVVLKDLLGPVENTLPIWLGATEALGISLALRQVDLGRPLTHDLFLNTLKMMQVEFMGASITRLEAGTFYAVLHLKQGTKIFEQDSRPSDAIILALRAGLEVWVAEEVLEAARENRLLPQATEQHLKPADRLDKLISQAANAQGLNESSMPASKNLDPNLNSNPNNNLSNNPNTNLNNNLSNNLSNENLYNNLKHSLNTTLSNDLKQNFPKDNSKPEQSNFQIPSFVTPEKVLSPEDKQLTDLLRDLEPVTKKMM